jgi:hypothetical protein
VASNNKTGVQLSTCIAADTVRLRQRYAYLALVFSAGKGSAMDWFATTSECSWTGIACTVNNAVAVLLLNGKGLKGIIPADVGLWTGLLYFFVSDNQLGGSLPSSIGLWTGLIRFEAYGNQLGGSLPSSIGKWTGLTDFSVKNNSFAGSLPSSIGLWTSIIYFDVGMNKMTGTIPKEVMKWTSIQFAYFDINKFNGTMPSIGGNFCPNSGSEGFLGADCLAPEIACDCCNLCS